MLKQNVCSEHQRVELKLQSFLNLQQCTWITQRGVFYFIDSWSYFLDPLRMGRKKYRYLPRFFCPTFCLLNLPMLSYVLWSEGEVYSDRKYSAEKLLQRSLLSAEHWTYFLPMCWHSHLYGAIRHLWTLRSRSSLYRMGFWSFDTKHL